MNGSLLKSYSESRALAIVLNIWPLDHPGGFYVRSKSREDVGYWMVHTPEGFAVHQGEGCEGEQFRGVQGCWHTKQFRITPTKENGLMTETAVAVVNNSLVPARIDFTEEQERTIASVICSTTIQGQTELAPKPFVELFLAACRHTGLDPFLKQIYAMKLKGKWTIFVGVDGHRVVAERTGLVNGIIGPEWSDDGKEWFDFPFTKKPNFCRVAVKRKGVDTPFISTLRMDSRINDNAESWQKDPSGMLAKCCEVQALRRAFPADMAMLDELPIEVEDVDTGAPMTRAEVPEGTYRVILEPAVRCEAGITAESGQCLKDAGHEGAHAFLQPEEKPTIDKVAETANQNAEKAAEKAAPARRAARTPKAQPEAPAAQDEPPVADPSVQEAYDKAFTDNRVGEFAGGEPNKEEPVVARPEPPVGEPQEVPGAPETKAQEMSKFWAAAKKFEKDTKKIIDLSKQYFGGAPAELEGIRRTQLLQMLLTGEIPEAPVAEHESSMVYTEEGEAICEVCKKPVDEETGKHL